MNNRAEPIVVEQQFSKPIQDVWEAITVKKLMIRWFFEDIPNFRPEAGFETSFDVDSGKQIFRHLWKITEARAPSKIVYHWSYEGIEGVGTVTFELTEIAAGTLLRLTNKGLDTFPDDIPEFSRESCIGGWEYFIKDRLKHFLDG